MSPARATCVLLLVLLSITGCTSATQGRGSGASRSAASSSSPDFPSSSSASRVPSTPSSTAAPATSAAPAPTLAQRLQHLQAQTNGQPNVLVRVPSGYEAAVYDQAGHIQFWQNPTVSTTWRQVGSSSYPAVPSLGPPDARVVGALLLGMAHATFIVRGTFTTDGGGNAVAFTTGTKGWGAIKAQSNGNIGPSGSPVGKDRIGLSYDFGFAGGYLVTEDCPTNRPLAECGEHTISKQWRWSGQDFHLR